MFDFATAVIALFSVSIFFAHLIEAYLTRCNEPGVSRVRYSCGGLPSDEFKPPLMHVSAINAN